VLYPCFVCCFKVFEFLHFSVATKFGSLAKRETLIRTKTSREQLKIRLHFCRVREVAGTVDGIKPVRRRNVFENCVFFSNSDVNGRERTEILFPFLIKC
jgi:hypothetical protein